MCGTVLLNCSYTCFLLYTLMLRTYKVPKSIRPHFPNAQVFKVRQFSRPFTVMHCDTRQFSVLLHCTTLYSRKSQVKEV